MAKAPNKYDLLESIRQTKRMPEDVRCLAKS